MKRCDYCDYAKEIKAQDGWSFIGCIHNPYKGMRVCEIKDCPLSQEEKALLKSKQNKIIEDSFWEIENESSNEIG